MYACVQVCPWRVCVCCVQCVFVSVHEHVAAEGPQKEDGGCEMNMLLQKPEVCPLSIFSSSTLKRETEKHAHRPYRHALLFILKSFRSLSCNFAVPSLFQTATQDTTTNGDG